MGQTLVIVNDSRLAFELMEKRSVKHSSRPKMVFAGEMYVETLVKGRLSDDIEDTDAPEPRLIGWVGKMHSRCCRITIVSEPTARAWPVLSVPNR